MTWSPEKIFEMEGNVIEIPMELIKEFQFYLKDISVPIKIRLFKQFGSDKVYFTQSHYIRTPLQANKYTPSRPYNDSLGLSLNQAVNGLTQYYNEAIAKGHIPSHRWLIPNRNY